MMVVLYVLFGTFSAAMWVAHLWCAVVLFALVKALFFLPSQLKKNLTTYARNIALSGDQDLATKGFGQDPDVSISAMLGRAKIAHREGKKVHPFWLWFGEFVDTLFYNRLWKIEENHIMAAVEPEEKQEHRIFVPYS